MAEDETGGPASEQVQESGSEPTAAGTSVQPEFSATAEVNPERTKITLYSRANPEIELEVWSDQAAALMRVNPDLTYIKYDLDGSEEDFIRAYRMVEEAALRLFEARKKLGYIPEEAEAAWNQAWGGAVRAANVVSLALGATLPNEAEVRAWAEHTDKHGSIDVEQFPNLQRAANHSATIESYKGGSDGNNA